VKLNDRIEHDVKKMLFRDPRVDEAETAVSVEEGVVTLRGTVGSLGAKRAAEQDAKRVPGVTEVHNELEVRLLTGRHRDDAELRGAVLQVLAWNAWIPDSVDASVKDGLVTLHGTVDFPHQREEAQAAVLNLHGVTDVRNEIKVRNVAMVEDASARIEEAFERIARTDARAITVEAVEGTVTLDGFVTSWAERNAAIDAVWMIPGVKAVDDQLGIAG
jgi:osmotically-inducible protein OsmY